MRIVSVCENDQNVCTNDQNVCENGQNVCENGENVCENGENVICGNDQVLGKCHGKEKLRLVFTSVAEKLLKLHRDLHNFFCIPCHAT